MIDKYKNLRTLVILWCLAKWENCDITYLDKLSIYSADIIVFSENNKIGFIFTINKTTEFIKHQVTNCKKTYDMIYLITNTINNSLISKIEKNIIILNIANKYNLGNIIEEL